MVKETTVQRLVTLVTIPNPTEANMAIKKAFVDLIKFLEDNSASKVKTIMPTVIELCSAKSGGGKGGAQTFLKNAAGEVTHIFCYYHKMWEEVQPDMFGTKSTSPTGLSNMCKEGTSHWTKQFREAKKESEALLDKVSTGEIDPTDIKGLKADIEANRAVVIPREDGNGSVEMPTV